MAKEEEQKKRKTLAVEKKATSESDVSEWSHNTCCVVLLHLKVMTRWRIG